jgi:cytidine deaminase
MPTDPASIDWETLRAAAREAQSHAYVPYSKFRVGAAALVDDGRIISGCNIENASYGLTLCAECALLGQLHMGGGGRLVAVVCVGNDTHVTPCGRCRQLLWEHGGPNMWLEVEGTPRPLSEMLPVAFPERSVFENPAE